MNIETKETGPKSEVRSPKSTSDIAQRTSDEVIERPTKKTGKFWPLVALLVAAGIVAWLLFPHVLKGQVRENPTNQTAARAGGGRGGPGGGGGNMSVPVVAAVATRGDMPVYLNGLGSVTSLNNVTVRTRVDGQLMSVNFKEGDLVRKGELLAQIDPRPFEVQLVQAEGQLARDQATLKNAQLDLERYKALYAQDAVPKQQLDTAQSTVNQYEGVSKSDQGAIDNAKLNLTYSRIIAPVSGRVGLRLVDPGNIVHASDANGIITITERQPIGVLFTIAEDSLQPVLKELHAGRTLTVEAWDRDLKTKLGTGRLLSIDNAIDQSTGTVRLKAEFANEDESLFPNQFVNARLLVDTVKGTVIVPAAAIQRNQDTSFVYVVRPDNTVEVRNVDVQLTEGDNAAVQGGLQPGEKVVTEGVDRLQQGMRVAARIDGGAQAPVQQRNSNGNRRGGQRGQATPAGSQRGNQ